MKLKYITCSGLATCLMFVANFFAGTPKPLFYYSPEIPNSLKR